LINSLEGTQDNKPNHEIEEKKGKKRKKSVKQENHDRYLERVQHQYNKLKPFPTDEKPIYVLGYKTHSKQFPRMHCKFFVFYNEDRIPVVAWNGSWNATATAERSEEAVTILHDMDAAKSFENRFLIIRSKATSYLW